MQEGANEILLCDERDGGGKRKQHVPHHSFAQRLYSKLHSFLASLVNLKFSSAPICYTSNMSPNVLQGAQNFVITDSNINVANSVSEAL